MRLVGTAASGLRAQQVALDIVGNNIANVNTVGYKENKINFAEALSTEVNAMNARLVETTGTIGLGSGVLHNANGRNLQQGTLLDSDRPLDLGISGSGFFQVKMSDGRTGYTRAGSFQVDESGRLADRQGNVVQSGILVPLEATDLSVASNGEIAGLSNGEKRIFGQILLVEFQNPEGLQDNGDNLFLATVNSGLPQAGEPGTATINNQVLGTIRSQSLEQSNVNLAASMTDLIQIQRAYQMNAKLVQDGDKMWGIANSMRR